MGRRGGRGRDEKSEIRNFGGGVLVVEYVLNNKSGCRAGCPHSAGVEFCRL